MDVRKIKSISYNYMIRSQIHFRIILVTYYVYDVLSSNVITTCGESGSLCWPFIRIDTLFGVTFVVLLSGAGYRVLLSSKETTSLRNEAGRLQLTMSKSTLFFDRT